MSLHDFFFYTGVTFWAVVITTVMAAILFCLGYFIWHFTLASIFLVRRFRTWERGGFKDEYPLWWCIPRALFRYTFMPETRWIYMQHPETGKRVYYPLQSWED